MASSNETDISSSEILRDGHVDYSNRFNSSLNSLGDAIIQNQFSSYTAPEDRITLSWSNLSASLTVFNQNQSKLPFAGNNKVWNEIEKPLLRNVYGIANPGSILAVIGSSGAGKSTLLNLLMGRVNPNFKVHGQAKANGAEIGRDISKFSAYVQQDDVFHPSLTVGEHLWFHAKLRMPDKRYSDTDRHEKIQTVLVELGLAKCFHLLIGGPSGGNYNEKTLSGGERKRLAFATEVLTNPSVLFCDEPTTGLDTFMAEQIVYSMKQLALRGKTIVCTLHTPSSKSIELLDHLLLLNEGRVVYHGPARRVSDYFASIGQECPESFNPFDHVIAVLSSRDIQFQKPKDSEGYHTQLTDYQIDKLHLNKALIEKADALAEIYKKTKYYRSLHQEISIASQPDMRTRLFEKRLKTESGSASLWTQLKLNVWRSFKMLIRSRRMFTTRIISTLFLSAVYSLTFISQPYDQKGSMNIVGLIYQLSTMAVWENIEPYTMTIPKEMPVFKREQQINMYSPALFFLGRSFLEIPQILMFSTIIVSIVYWSTNLYPYADHFFYAIFVHAMASWVASGIGYLLGFAFDNPSITFGVQRAMSPVLNLTAGQYINLDTMPVWISWIRFVSPTYYVNELLQVNQWADVSSLECEQRKADGSKSSCFQDGPAVLDYYGFRIDDVTRNILCLVGLLFGIRLAALVVLTIRTQRNKDDA